MDLNESMTATKDQADNTSFNIAAAIDQKPLANIGPTFLQLSTFRVENMFNTPIMKSGLYGWHKCFDGVFEKHHDVKGSLHKFDIIMIIVDRGIVEHGLMRRVRKEIDNIEGDKKPVVVASCDYGVEMWQDSMPVCALTEQMQYADFYFVSEPAMQECLEAATGIKAEMIRHPVNVNEIRKLTTPVDQRFKRVGSVSHAWEGNWCMPHLALHDLPYPNEMVFMKPIPRPDMCAFFDKFSPARPYMESLKWLSECWVYLESYNMMHTYGRTVAEAAALGVPAVGSVNVMAMRDLYPLTTTPAGAVMQQRNLIIRLCEDQDFYNEVVEYATKRVENYSYRSCKKAIMELVGYE